MKKISTTIGVAALVVSTAACTPAQVMTWIHAREQVSATPDTSDDVALQASFDALPEPNTVCNEWYWYAIEAGFSHEQWMNPLSRIMNAESGCNPNAYNPSGATGLTQVMKMWADDCGGVPADLFDPQFNLNCARLILDVQGWNAWVTY